MVPVYVKSLLPLFCKTYQSTMITSVKKSSLSLNKKMIYYLTPPLLKEVCSENKDNGNFFTSIKSLPRCKTCVSELKLPHPHRYQEARWDDPNTANVNIVHFLKPRPNTSNLPKATFFDG